MSFQFQGSLFKHQKHFKKFGFYFNDGLEIIEKRSVNPLVIKFTVQIEHVFMQIFGRNQLQLKTCIFIDSDAFWSFCIYAFSIILRSSEIVKIKFRNEIDYIDLLKAKHDSHVKESLYI